VCDLHGGWSVHLKLGIWESGYELLDL
jgi:hypothetical protein